MPFLNGILGAIFQESLLAVAALEWVGLAIVVLSGFLFLLAIIAFKAHETDKIATSGIFRYVRHPMELSMLMLAFGLMFWKLLSIASAIAYLVLVVCSFIALQREEEFLIHKFGDEYREYMQRVPALNILAGLVRSSRLR